MRRFLAFYLIFSLGEVARAVDLSSKLSKDWRVISIPHAVAAWKNSSTGDEIIIMSEKSAGDGFGSSSEEDVKTGILGMRRITLAQFGYNDWMIDDFKMQKDGKTVDFTGHYTSKQGDIVYFAENHRFTGSDFIQKTLIRRSGTKVKLSSARALLEKVNVR